ncbi:hypothetical protein HDE_09329 [Halotydeus destructor]|nr:hypothetical protein HDE_09329 [Halotydeus destructor]
MKANTFLRTIFTCCTFFALSSLSTASPVKNETHCDDLLLKADTCFKKLMKYGELEASLPRTVDELVETCRTKDPETHNCFKRYALQCLPILPKTLFKIASKQSKENAKSVCETDQGQQDFLKHTKCLQPDKLPLVHQYMDITSLYLSHVANNVTIGQVIPFMCCGYFLIVKDSVDEINKMCPENGAETADYLLGFSDSVSGELIAKGCGDFGSIDKCNSSLPEAVQLYQQFTDEVTNGGQVDHSPLLPSIVIVGRLNDDLPQIVSQIVWPLLNTVYVYIAITIILLFLSILILSCILDCFSKKSQT